jgi:hypothetical protein
MSTRFLISLTGHFLSVFFFLTREQEQKKDMPTLTMNATHTTSKKNIVDRTHTKFEGKKKITPAPYNLAKKKNKILKLILLHHANAFIEVVPHGGGFFLGLKICRK